MRNIKILAWKVRQAWPDEMWEKIKTEKGHLIGWDVYLQESAHAAQAYFSWLVLGLPKTVALDLTPVYWGEPLFLVQRLLQLREDDATAIVAEFSTSIGTQSALWYDGPRELLHQMKREPFDDGPDEYFYPLDMWGITARFLADKFHIEYADVDGERLNDSLINDRLEAAFRSAQWPDLRSVLAAVRKEQK